MVVGKRLGLWTPISAHTAFALAAALAALAALTFLPLGQLAQWGHGLRQHYGESVLVYLVVVGAAIAIALLIVMPH